MYLKYEGVQTATERYAKQLFLVFSTQCGILGGYSYISPAVLSNNCSGGAQLSIPNHMGDKQPLIVLILFFHNQTSNFLKYSIISWHLNILLPNGYISNKVFCVAITVSHLQESSVARLKSIPLLRAAFFLPSNLLNTFETLLLWNVKWPLTTTTKKGKTNKQKCTQTWDVMFDFYVEPYFRLFYILFCKLQFHFHSLSELCIKTTWTYLWKWNGLGKTFTLSQCLPRDIKKPHQ